MDFSRSDKYPFWRNKVFLVLNNWKHFFISIMIVAALGYFTLFFITFDKNEKREFVKIIKDKLSNE